MSAGRPQVAQALLTSAPTTTAGGRAVTVLFATTLFTSASLVFIAEPMFGKMALPRLGGTPAVWNTCMVFYQAVLLAGYAYAHLLTTRCRLGVQIVLHAALLLLALLALPVSLPASWAPPVDRSPIPSLLLALLTGVGAPLFVLSATAPLLQRWFSATNSASARDPYFLYAASNVGSILALLAYPLVIEPTSSLGTQTAQWSLGYGVLTALTVACGLLTRRRRATSTQALGEPSQNVTTIAWIRRLKWLALSLVPSSLMLAVTTYIATDVGSVPLLWTIPLALYLLSFILGFASRRLLPDPWAGGAASVALVALVCVLAVDINRPLLFMLGLHLSALFLLALALHSALAGDRPAPEHLTEFYLWIAAGGVAGGLFNTLVAPVVFTSIAEYPLMLAAAAWLLPRSVSARPERRDLVWPLVCGLAATALVFLIRQPAVPPLAIAPALAVLVVAVLSSARTAFGFGLATMLILGSGLLGRTGSGELIYARRTFFGVLRVWDVGGVRQHRIAHGTTIHGVQSTIPGRQRDPLSYYHPSGPIGQVFTALDRKLADARIAVVGLGAGGLTAYAQPGQRWTFFEIDPAVEEVARDTRFFTYLRDCGDRCTVQLGDARLALARASDRYDMIVLDAFSSDAIPVHLITREAMALYLQRLRPQGVLVFHISNRHLSLRSLVAGLAADQHLVLRDQFFGGKTADMVQTQSEWVAMARTEQDLGSIADDPRWIRVAPTPATRIWSDDFSDILSVLKR